MNHKNLFLTAAVALLCAVPVTAHAEKMIMDHSQMDHSKMMAMPTENSPSTTAGIYDKAMSDMQAAMMAVKPTGDADVDFVQGMIPHHQGAIDMAKVQLAKGTDPEIRKLCEGIIAAQEKEIAMMQEWLKKHRK